MRVRVNFYSKPEPGGKRQRRIAQITRDASDVVNALGFVYATLQRTRDKALLDRVSMVKIETLTDAEAEEEGVFSL